MGPGGTPYVSMCSPKGFFGHFGLKTGVDFAHTAGPNHPPEGLLRLNLRIFYISFHFSTKLAR